MALQKLLARLIRHYRPDHATPYCCLADFPAFFCDSKMGQQPSKSADGSKTPRNLSSTSLDKSASDLPFSKSDTKESARSFRGLRSKIPGGRSESPRSSFSQADATAADLERADTGTSNKSGGSSKGKPRVESLSQDDSDGDNTPTRTGSPHPPPSPTMSASVGKGHKAVDKAQQQGEVDHVSDAPPSGSYAPQHNQQPKDSILMKTNLAIPRSSKAPKAPSSPYLTPAGDDDTVISSSPRVGFGAAKSLDVDEMITRLLDAGYSTKITKTVCLKNAEITAICSAVREVFLSQPALVELTAPVKIVGDVHGQYTDLIRMFEMCGFPPNANFLFLGDYVDRGKQSLETILLLFCYKLKYPENFFLLRGNHECANVTRVYGFYDECKRRCNIKIWKTFIDTFNCLPIAAIVAGKIFCVHGGLSPSLTHMDDIRQIARPTDVPDYGLLNDLLWSDPADMEADWEANERGVSYCFGKKIIMEFLQRHDFDLVCRAHMVVEDGYEFFNDRILVTVFSAPNVSRA